MWYLNKSVDMYVQGFMQNQIIASRFGGHMDIDG